MSEQKGQETVILEHAAAYEQRIDLLDLDAPADAPRSFFHPQTGPLVLRPGDVLRLVVVRAKP